jgi:hypothetical protein
MDEVTLGPAHLVPGLSLVIWYHPKPKVLEDQLPSIRLGTGWSSDGCYFQTGLLGLTSWPGRDPQAGFRSGCQATFTQQGPHHYHWAAFLEPDGRLDEVLHEHAQRGLIVARPESGEGINCFVVSLDDMMKFESIKLLLEFSYLLAVCRHAGVTTV